MRQFKKEGMQSSSNFFLVNRGVELIKLRKGMSKSAVIETLGEPYPTGKDQDPKNQKLLFKLCANGSKHKWYKILFINDTLEWAMKINHK